MVGLEVTVIQSGVLDFLAGGPADVHVEHVLQALHYLRETEGRAGYIVQEGW